MVKGCGSMSEPLHMGDGWVVCNGYREQVVGEEGGWVKEYRREVVQL